MPNKYEILRDERGYFFAINGKRPDYLSYNSFSAEDHRLAYVVGFSVLALRLVEAEGRLEALRK